jgi:hypothetical protein
MLKQTVTVTVMCAAVFFGMFADGSEGRTAQGTIEDASLDVPSVVGAGAEFEATVSHGAYNPDLNLAPDTEWAVGGTTFTYDWTPAPDSTDKGGTSATFTFRNPTDEKEVSVTIRAEVDVSGPGEDGVEDTDDDIDFTAWQEETVSKNVTVISVRVERASGSFPKCSRGGITNNDFIVDTTPQGFEDEVTLLYDEIAAEGTEGMVTLTCRAQLNGETADTCNYQLLVAGTWFPTSWTDEKVRLDQTCPESDADSKTEKGARRLGPGMWVPVVRKLTCITLYSYFATESQNQGPAPCPVTSAVSIDHSQTGTFGISWHGLNLEYSKTLATSETKSVTMRVQERGEGREYQVRAFQQHWQARWTAYWRHAGEDTPWHVDNAESGNSAWIGLYHFAQGTRWRCPAD